MTTQITGEVFGEEREGPRAWLTAEAQKPFVELLPPLAEAHAALDAALAGVSESQSRFQPSVGEGEDAWGIAQVVRHLAWGELRFGARVWALALNERTPPPPGAAPGDDDPRSFDELKAALAASYVQLLAYVAEVDGRERLDTTFNHPFFGALNCRATLALQTLHANDHARQIERIKASPAFPAA